MLARQQSRLSMSLEQASKVVPLQDLAEAIYDKKLKQKEGDITADIYKTAKWSEGAKSLQAFAMLAFRHQDSPIDVIDLAEIVIHATAPEAKVYAKALCAVLTAQEINQLISPLIKIEYRKVANHIAQFMRSNSITSELMAEQARLENSGKAFYNNEIFPYLTEVECKIQTDFKNNPNQEYSILNTDLQDSLKSTLKRYISNFERKALPKFIKRNLANIYKNFHDHNHKDEEIIKFLGGYFFLRFIAVGLNDYQMEMEQREPYKSDKAKLNKDLLDACKRQIMQILQTPIQSMSNKFGTTPTHASNTNNFSSVPSNPEAQHKKSFSEELLDICDKHAEKIANLLLSHAKDQLAEELQQEFMPLCGNDFAIVNLTKNLSAENVFIIAELEKFKNFFDDSSFTDELVQFIKDDQNNTLALKINFIAKLHKNKLTRHDVKYYLNQKDKTGLTPLCAAASQNNFAIKFLLDNGAEVNQKSNSGSAPLHGAAANKNLDAIKFLLKKHAEVDIKDASGKTALMIACETGNLAIIVYLLKKNANINSTDNNKDTPLHFAAQARDIAVISKLLQSGADINAKNIRGITPFGMILDGEILPMLQLMLKQGKISKANLNVKNQNGKTALMLAVERSDISLIKRLIELDADVTPSFIDKADQENTTTYTVLDIAIQQAQRGDNAILKLLLLSPQYDRATQELEAKLVDARGKGEKEILTATIQEDKVLAFGYQNLFERLKLTSPSKISRINECHSAIENALINPSDVTVIKYFTCTNANHMIDALLDRCKSTPKETLNLELLNILSQIITVVTDTIRDQKINAEKASALIDELKLINDFIDACCNAAIGELIENYPSDEHIKFILRCYQTRFIKYLIFFKATEDHPAIYNIRTLIEKVIALNVEDKLAPNLYDALNRINTLIQRSTLPINPAASPMSFFADFRNQPSSGIVENREHSAVSQPTLP